jgi:hypothetical protein
VTEVKLEHSVFHEPVFVCTAMSEGIQLSDGLSGYFLRIPIKLQLSPYILAGNPSKDYRITVQLEGAELHIGYVNHGTKYNGNASKSFLCDTLCEALYQICPGYPTGYNPHCPVFLISSELLEIMESNRNGNDAQFTLFIRGTARVYEKLAQVKDAGSPSPRYKVIDDTILRCDAIPITIPQSDWVRQLEQASHSISLLVECPIPMKKEEQTGTFAALAALKQARNNYYLGKYTDCVVKCREVLSAVKLKGLDKYLKLEYSELRNMSKRERLELAVAATRHISHLGHHPESLNGDDFSRAEASAILALTSAALHLVTRGAIPMFTGASETMEET